MAYTDMRGVLTFKKMLSYQRMQKLGDNDAENHIPSGTVWEFFQTSAPTGWIKQTAVNDVMCRVVSGAGAGSGGSQPLSTGLVLAHTHTVAAHSHTMPAHQHILDYTIVSGFSHTVEVGTTNADDQVLLSIGNAAGTTITRQHKNRTQSDGNGGSSATSSPATDSQLSTLIPQYIDVIVCTKT